MSAETKSLETTVRVTVSHLAPPAPVMTDKTCALTLPTDAERPAARLTATLARPGIVRDALLTLGDVLSSDLRRKARDRADYLAYLISKAKGVTKEVWEAQKEFLALKYNEAQKSEAPLDPVVTVSPEGLRLEVFSRDESAYGSLLLRAGEAYTARDSVPGTTHADLAAWLRPLGRLRGFRETSVSLAPSGEGKVTQTLAVPYRWARSFGQMQAASVLPRQSFPLAPVDLYNVLFTLRMRKAKQAPRALRYELVPGEAPRIVLEPWDIVLGGGGGPYRGDRPVVVRTWGRNRLATLGRLLPHARAITVQLVGPGLPAFYVVDLGDAVFTLGLSGWTDGGWAGVSTFDLLDPAGADAALGDRLRGLLTPPKTEAELVAASGAPADAVRAALLGELTTGRVGHDVASGRFFARDLFATPLSLDRLRYRDAREEAAHRLLAVAEQVRLAKVHDLGSEGTTIEGEINDKQQKRVFRPSFTIDREGRTTSAACSCASFQRAGIKEGPCEHMIALRLLYGREQAALERARNTPEGRRLIRAETRVFLRRDAAGTSMFRVSLDGRQMVVRFGKPECPRLQRIFFDDADTARGQYFAKLEELQQKGFIDASLAE